MGAEDENDYNAYNVYNFLSARSLFNTSVNEYGLSAMMRSSLVGNE